MRIDMLLLPLQNEWNDARRSRAVCGVIRIRLHEQRFLSIHPYRGAGRDEQSRSKRGGRMMIESRTPDEVQDGGIDWMPPETIGSAGHEPPGCRVGRRMKASPPKCDARRD